MIEWMIYTKIHELKNNGFRKTQVARRLNINRETVSTYWDMSPGEYADKEVASKKRKKKADEYKEFVLECLTKYPDMSAAQIYDWIKERTCLETLDFQKRAFRSYVQAIREEYDIKKPVSSRQYEAVEELPMGQQAQVDMGEISLETTTGRKRKVYCFAMVLAHSRYKFILWQERPFTTDTFKTAHMKAFEFYGLSRGKEIMKTQNYKIIFLGIIASVLFVGCGNVRMNSIFDDDSIENSANSSSKSYLENNAIDYTVNDDGTYTCNGNIYKYKLTLTGDTSESGKVGIFIVLTNDKNLTFDEVFDCLISSKLDAGESHFILIGSM